MIDKFSDDVDAFCIDDVETTESFSLTSQGRIAKLSDIPSPGDTQASEGSTGFNKSFGKKDPFYVIVSTSFLYLAMISNMPKKEDIQKYYNALKAKKELAKKRAWRRYISYRLPETCF